MIKFLVDNSTKRQRLSLCLDFHCVFYYQDGVGEIKYYRTREHVCLTSQEFITKGLHALCSASVLDLNCPTAAVQYVGHNKKQLFHQLSMGCMAQCCG